MDRYRVAVGHDHNVKPGNIVGAIANEAGIDSKEIGRINIHDGYSLIDLPEGMPKDIFNTLKKVRVSGHPLLITRLAKERKPDYRDKDKRKGKGKAKDKGKDKSAAKSKKSGKKKKLKLKRKEK